MSPWRDDWPCFCSWQPQPPLGSCQVCGCPPARVARAAVADPNRITARAYPTLAGWLGGHRPAASGQANWLANPSFELVADPEADDVPLGTPWAPLLAWDQDAVYDVAPAAGRGGGAALTAPQAAVDRFALLPRGASQLVAVRDRAAPAGWLRLSLWLRWAPFEVDAHRSRPRDVLTVSVAVLDALGGAGAAVVTLACACMRRSILAAPRVACLDSASSAVARVTVRQDASSPTRCPRLLRGGRVPAGAERRAAADGARHAPVSQRQRWPALCRRRGPGARGQPRGLRRRVAAAGHRGAATGRLQAARARDRDVRRGQRSERGRSNCGRARRTQLDGLRAPVAGPAAARGTTICIASLRMSLTSRSRWTTVQPVAGGGQLWVLTSWGGRVVLAIFSENARDLDRLRDAMVARVRTRPTRRRQL